MTRRPLAGITVHEDGDRLAVAACGSVLAAFGAQVSVARSTADYRAAYPPAHADEKRFVTAEAAEDLRARADVILRSSDVSPRATASHWPHQICCDITAYGASGPLAGVAHADPLLQAMSGLADTTGEPDAPPALCKFPVVEGIGALYATSGILTALLVRKRIGRGQAVEIALFDCAFSTLATFMPFHFVGRPVTRAGNRHVLASPWNTYRARDAWLVICTGSDEQWLRLCQVLGRSDLAADPRLGRGPDRVLHRAVVDDAVQRWIEGRTAADAAEALEAQGIAAGAVVAADALANEPNIRHRGLYSDHGMRSAIRYFDPAAAGAAASGECAIPSALSSEDTVSALPLADLKVIELGQYTTAPFVARHLGALGADVLKIESSAGDATRTWPPQRDGQGYFFCLSNSDKRSCCLDLRAKDDRARFSDLLAGADVLVENLKPGSLQKLGLAPRAATNPRLVYCAISGFGADSAYPGRPAFDTVIQAMSGIMDSIRQNDRPQKAGISLADILGGLFALAGTLSALLDRAQNGKGDALDISMQDAAAWITQWSDPTSPQTDQATLQCRDGYVVAMAAFDEANALSSFLQRSRADVVAQLREQGIEAAPVLSIDEVARCEQARVRKTLVHVRDSQERDWQVFNTPIRLSVTSAAVRRAIGPLGEASASDR